MERKFSHFHISRLLVPFLNDIANILPVLLHRALTSTAGGISKALWVLSSNLLFLQGFSVPQDGRINPDVRSTWPAISLGLAGETAVCLHCLGQTRRPVGLGAWYSPDTQLRRARCTRADVCCPLATGGRAERWKSAHPWSFFLPGAICCPSAEPPLVAALVPLKSTRPLQGAKRFPAEATCLFPAPTQPWGWCAIVCLLCSSGTQWSWAAFKSRQQVSVIVHLSPGLWLWLTRCVSPFFSSVLLTWSFFFFMPVFANSM